MPYSYITLNQALTQLALRLDDTSNVFWSGAELTLYLQESLRCWQSVSGYWRGHFAFNLAQGVNFYDLTQQTTSLISYNVKDSDLASVMLYHLLEPQLSAGLYVGTDMFSLSDITNALQNRLNQFLEETGMVLGISTLAWPAPPTGRAPLLDTTIDVRRAAWFGAISQKFSTLWRSNEFASRAFNPTWALAPTDPPAEYSIASEPPVTLQLIPPPANPGQVQLLTLNVGQVLSPGIGVLLNIPDNLAWVVKWGALADLLIKEGQAQDLPRAAYCEQRYREGIQIARVHTSVVNAQPNGVQQFVNALQSLDAFLPNWQNDTPGPPVDVALASWNMFVVHPAPDALGPYSMALDVVQNAPLPVLGGDFVQLGREELDVVLGYAQHLADFKRGGAEFLNTTGLYDNFLRLAGVYNERLRAAVDYFQPMSDRAIRDEQLTPRRIPIEQSQGA